MRTRPRQRYGTAALAALALVAGAVVGGGGRTAVAEEPAVLYAVGDVATCDDDHDGATARAVDRDPGAPIAMLGDVTNGFAPGEYECYKANWNRHKTRIHPVVGDQEHAGQQAGFGTMTDFRHYWGDDAPPVNGGYSWDVALPGGGSWHVVALNSACGDAKDPEYPNPCTKAEAAAQVEWLKQDLAAHPAVCTAAYWHHIYWDMSKAGNDGGTKGNIASHLRPLYEVLYQHGVDVVLNGHRHTYRRHAPMDPDANLDRDFGIRQFTVGTGGHTQKEDKKVGGLLEAALPADPNDPSVFESTFGVLRLELRSTGYSWEFVRAEGREYTDTGSAPCHNPPSGAAPTTATTAPPGSPPVTPPTAAPGATPTAERSGYWMLGVDGRVYPFGEAGDHGDAVGRLQGGVEAADLEPLPSGGGYWIVDRAGRVHAFGDAPDLGDLAGRLRAGESVTSLSSTPTGAGFWIFTDRGRVEAFGAAAHRGDMADVVLNGPVLDSVPTPTGGGYYMVASDGGIFAFGDARFTGSMGGKQLNAPVQSLVPDPDGGGYWLVARDGGVFAFDSGFRGSMGGRPLNRPVTGMVALGGGYLMVGEDGGIFDFSGDPNSFKGSLGANPPAKPITSVAVLG